ncbi:hypothetical protein DSECCO2_625050 [anaerobic digester metagenome]
MTTLDPTARAMSSTCRSVSFPPPTPVAGETMRVSPTSLTISPNIRPMLLPMMPREAIAMTPMTIPMTARDDRSQ